MPRIEDILEAAKGIVKSKTSKKKADRAKKQAQPAKDKLKEPKKPVNRVTKNEIGRKPSKAKQKNSEYWPDPYEIDKDVDMVALAKLVEQYIKQQIKSNRLIRSGKMLNSVKVRAVGNRLVVTAVKYFDYLQEEFGLLPDDAAMRVMESKVKLKQKRKKK